MDLECGGFRLTIALLTVLKPILSTRIYLGSCERFITWSFKVNTLAAVKLFCVACYLARNIYILCSSCMTLRADKKSFDVVSIKPCRAPSGPPTPTAFWLFL